MTRILFVGDLHAKPQLLPRISRTADRVQADHIIRLGDLMDDWKATGRSLIDWAETFCDWMEEERHERRVTVLIGNHDVPYLLEADTPEYARVRDYGTPGFHAKAQRKVFAILSGRLHELSTVWHDGHVLASHAGFTGSWLNGWPYGQPNTPISISLMFPGEPSKLASAYCQAGAARGGDSAPSPLWVDKSELIADHPVGLIQVVGHTPVPTVTNVDGLWFCDTMSTLPNGPPIGDGSMLLYTPGTEPIFNVVQATL